MRTLTIVQINSIFRVMAIMTVFTVVIAIFPSCRGKTKSLDATADQFVPAPPPSLLPYNINDGDTVWFRVDKLPVFSADSLAMEDFLVKNLVYPEAARKREITGRVVVTFILTKDCKVVNAKIIKGLDPDCDNEALRVVNLLPQFEKPAYVNGRPVAYHSTLPVHYELR
jgi:TonB family protein